MLLELARQGEMGRKCQIQQKIRHKDVKKHDQFGSLQAQGRRFGVDGLCKRRVKTQGRCKAQRSFYVTLRD